MRETVGSESRSGDLTVDGAVSFDGGTDLTTALAGKIGWDSAQTINAKTAAYTLLTADAGDLVTVDASGNVDITVDDSLDLSAGQRIDLLRLGSGEVTVVASVATVNGTPGLKLRAQYSAATLVCVGTDSYVLLGDLKA